MSEDHVIALYKAGKFKEALAAAVGEFGKSKYSPTRLVMVSGKLRCYRGNKSVEKDEKGHWRLAQLTHPDDRDDPRT